jgi:predicted permease
LRQVLLVQAAMPAAVTPILIARMYGGRPQIAMQVFLVTAVVGLFSMPLIVAWGMKWLGFE